MFCECGVTLFFTGYKVKHIVCEYSSKVIAETFRDMNSSNSTTGYCASKNETVTNPIDQERKRDISNVNVSYLGGEVTARLELFEEG